MQPSVRKTVGGPLSDYVLVKSFPLKQTSIVVLWYLHVQAFVVKAFILFFDDMKIGVLKSIVYSKRPLTQSLQLGTEGSLYN